MIPPRVLLLPVLGLAGSLLPVLAHSAPAPPDLPILTDLHLTLRNAQGIATKNNVTLKQRQADADTAGAAARSAQAQTKLSLSTTTYGTVGDSANILTTSPGVAPQNIFSVAPQGFADQNLMLMVPLFTGGRLGGALAAARGQKAAATLSVQASRLAVAEAVEEDYVNAVLRQALVGVAQARQDAENEQVRVTQEKVTAGRSAPVDLSREQAEQADAEQAVLAAQNDAALAVIDLKAFLGVSQESQIAPTDTLDSLAESDALPATLTDALREADTRRPELAAAQRQIEAAQAGRYAARGEYAPQIYAVAMGDATAAQGFGRTGYTVGLTASLPLLDGDARRADADAAQARLERAQADAQAARQAVDHEVATAWLMAQTARAQAVAAESGVTAAQEGYTLADLRYNAGKSTTAERLDALSALVRAQGTLAQARAGAITARAHVAAALGRGEFSHGPSSAPDRAARNP